MAPVQNYITDAYQGVNWELRFYGVSSDRTPDVLTPVIRKLSIWGTKFNRARLVLDSHNMPAWTSIYILATRPGPLTVHVDQI